MAMVFHKKNQYTSGNNSYIDSDNYIDEVNGVIVSDLWLEYGTNTVNVALSKSNQDVLLDW